MRGQIITSHGRHYLVATPDGQHLQAYARGRRNDLITGDWVTLSLQGDQAAIEALQPRQSLLFRSDVNRSKLLAANATQLWIVVATEPFFSEDFLGRALVAARTIDLPVQIILNKTDLPTYVQEAQQRLGYYTQHGHVVHPVSVRAQPDATRERLQPLLQDHTTLLIGQSGMGKSSLLNLLYPNAEARTREFSSALNSGKHTTTHTQLYRLDAHTALIDSPGFQAFGLHHLSQSELAHAFTEFKLLLGQCRFYNCQHRNEPGCAILEAVGEKLITPQRHALYVQLLEESQRNSYEK